MVDHSSLLFVAIICSNETTNSIYWPTTIAGRTSTQPCFTTVPDGFKATRECDLFGRWSSPNVSDCKNGILRYIKFKYIFQIFVFSTLQLTLLYVSSSFSIITAQPTLVLHPSGGVYNPEIQRQFVLSCQAEDGYPATNLTWLKKVTGDDGFGKLQNALISYLIYISCALLAVSVPKTRLVNAIPSISLVLTQRIVNNTVILETSLPGITTMADGEYLCRGENVFASSNISVNISAKGIKLYKMHYLINCFDFHLAIIA